MLLKQIVTSSQLPPEVRALFHGSPKLDRYPFSACAWVASGMLAAEETDVLRDAGPGLAQTCKAASSFAGTRTGLRTYLPPRI